MYIYTPPGYDANTNEKYPVLYILHGGGEDQTGWATQGKTDLIIDNLIAAKKAKPMLVVMMDGNFGSGGIAGFGEQSLKTFENELLKSGNTICRNQLPRGHRIKQQGIGRFIYGWTSDFIRRRKKFAAFFLPGSF
jgi:hypothetical protein